ncbi:MAG TPA: MBL fold metallo-hydrolase [Mycobacteriales bacterium]|nr:MBL fold metallo-hydrolase [Mycobacteriales bacterium]
MTLPEVTATWLGAATVLLRVGALSLLTDPALDPADQEQVFHVPGSDIPIPLRRTSDPVLPPGGLPRLDAVLLSHDEHADNLDARGRAVAAGAGRILTTPSGARRLGGRAEGLERWASVELERAGTRVRVTATPARHGPAGMEAVVGDVTGFVVEIEGLARAVYISGDTVLHDDLTAVGRRFAIGPALLHLGRARFDLTGPTCYSLSGADGVALAADLGATALLPVHHEGWVHFSEPAVGLERALRGSPVPVLWPTPGVPVDLRPAMAGG